MDRTDKKILQALQRDCRQSVADLAERVGLSPSACHRRVKQLEEQGLIAGYGAHLDRRKLGYTMEFFVEISLASQSEDALRAFEDAVRRVPEILECHLMSGVADYFLRIAATGPDAYERIHRERLGRLPGVAKIQSSLVLRTIQPWAGYPVPSD
ncbi:MAG: AsnC family transcriptional regulator [Hyphomicrobiales bacterium]|nr:MAG: AsnC family transcriptional regulator [Hyphomicrobiales bacterium]